ncbi:tigger transposable element-derived protein 4-like [Aphis craccivora]|uniref:Tigger transposable element-derived protein 4-like n=1 Tax=Aphis craccivora TaxID=307492 RepID=A0A6G0VQW1_APHCR|nr:tigger transposable element-derived protein 4-like [Aphis craccivora]
MIFRPPPILYELSLKQDETNIKHVYMEHCSGNMLYTEFKDFCTSCWRKGKFNFIVIIKDCERDNGRYRYGFDTKTEIQSLVTETFKPIIEPLNVVQNSTLDKNIHKYNIEDLHFYQINELLISYSIDKTYGPKLQPNKTVRLGKEEIKLVGNTIIVEDTTYLLTQGPCSLIFSKAPKLYTENDLKTYKSTGGVLRVLKEH